MLPGLETDAQTRVGSASLLVRQQTDYHDALLAGSSLLPRPADDPGLIP